MKAKQGKKPNGPKSSSTPANSPISSGKWLLIAGGVILLISFIACYQYVFDKKVSVNEDNISYILLAKGMKEGYGYVDYNQVDKRPANHFPPGYPFILMILMTISEDVQFLKLTSGLFFLGSLALLYFLAHRFKVPWPVTLAGLLFTLCNYHVASHSYETMSEMPFLFFSLLSIFFLTAQRQDRAFYKDPFFYAALASIALTYYIRAIGLSILFAALVYIWVELKQRYRAFAMLGGFILLALPWYIRGKVIDVPSGYETQVVMINPYRPEMGKVGVKDLFDRIGKNTKRYLSREIPSAIAPSLIISYEKPVAWWYYGIGLLVLGLCVYAILQMKTYRWLIGAYMVGLAGILALWPDVWFSTRFMMPFIPFMILLVIWSLVLLAGRWSGRQGVAWGALLLLPLLYFYIKFTAIPDFDNQYTNYPLERAKVESSNPYNPNWQRYFETAEWAKRNLPAGAVIACRKPLLYNYFSGFATDYYPYEENTELLLRKLQEARADYVIIDQLGFTSTSRYLVPAVQAHQDRFEVLYQTEAPETYVLRFKHTQ